MLKAKRLALYTLFFIFSLNFCLAQQDNSFLGEVISDNINVRTDSTVNSEVIYRATKGDIVEVILELYDWYKIRLPPQVILFLKKDLAAVQDNKTAKILKDRVNIRLKPDISCAVVGMMKEGEIVDIRGESGDWYKIAATHNSYGWIHKNFIHRLKVHLEKNIPSLPQQNDSGRGVGENLIIQEGVIRPKVLKAIATHKLITADSRVFLLKGDKESLDALNRQRVKLTGKIITSQQGYSVIEVKKVEVLD